MSNQRGGTRLILISAVLIWFISGCSMLQHGHEGHGVAQLSLNNGQRWATDAPLRQGMSKIKDAMESKLPSIRANSATDMEYGRLAEKIDADVAYMVQNCKLDRQTDAMLHLVIAEILAGTDAMQGKDKQLTQRDGALKIVGALDAYAQYFDHPDWRALPPE